MKNSLLFFLCCLLLLCACEKKNAPSKELRTVILTKTTAPDATSSKEYSGVIEEGKSVNASFMADGKIQQLFVKEGQKVSKGQLLATLDDADYKIGLNQLMAQYDQMTKEKERIDEMFQRHNIAPNDYEKFNAGYEQLKLQLEMMENKLSYTKLHSPSDGYIAEKFMEPGELVGAGTPVFKITDDSELIASVDLPVGVYMKRKDIIDITGITPALPDDKIPLTLESFTPDPSNNMLYQMKLSVPSRYSSVLSQGMNIRVKIQSNFSGNDGWDIPARSVFNDNGKNFVWVFQPQDSTIHKKEVIVLDSPEGNLINVSGLNGSELIVETGVKQLFDDEKVHPVDKSNFGL